MESRSFIRFLPSARHCSKLLYIVRHLIPIRALGDRYYSLQFINEETAAKRDCYHVAELGFEPWQADPCAILIPIMLHHHPGYFYAHFHVS